MGLRRGRRGARYSAATPTWTGGASGSDRQRAIRFGLELRAYPGRVFDTCLGEMLAERRDDPRSKTARYRLVAHERACRS